MSPTVVALIAIVLVAGLAMLLRRAGGNADPPADGDAPRHDLDAGRTSLEAGEGGVMVADDPDDDDLVDEPDTPSHVLVSSEGIALAPQTHSIRLIPLLREGDPPDWLQKGIVDGSVPYTVINEFYGFASHSDRGPASGTVLSAGDFTAARVRRDATGHWSVETLGRDGDFGFMPFGTEDRARDALAMFESVGIIRHVLDEHGDPVPPSPEDFEEARRRYAETERELALAADEDDPAPPEGYSTRR